MSIQLGASTTKRARSSSDSDAEQDTNIHSQSTPPAKQSRSLPSVTNRQLTCTLPPSCCPPNRPSILTNSDELEKHYALYHAHVCEVRSCSCIFPEARLLELHLTECHDPLTEVRKERGERTFECFLPRSACSKSFVDPKARRRHLIEAHGYPKEYFFAVTNKGIGGLLKRWGEGASLIRGTWQSRNSLVEENNQGAQIGDVAAPDRKLSPGDGRLEEPSGAFGEPASGLGLGDDPMEDISAGFQSLALVPDKIRFGRGGKSLGFAKTRNNAGKCQALSVEKSRSAVDLAMESEKQLAHSNFVTGRGRAGRGGRLQRVPGNHHKHNDDGQAESNFIAVTARGRGRGHIWVAR